MSVCPSICTTQSISFGICRPRSAIAEAIDQAPPDLPASVTPTQTEQNLALEYEPVSDDADILAVLQQIAQPSKEVRAIALQLLHLSRECRVQPLTQILDRFVALGALFLRRVERFVQRRDLPPQLRQLLIKKIDFAIASDETAFCDSSSLVRIPICPAADFALSSPSEAAPDSFSLSALSVASIDCSSAT